MSKAEYKRAVIAALIGALVTFLTKLAESLAGLPTDATNNVIGGLSASFAYLKMVAKIHA